MSEVAFGHLDDHIIDDLTLAEQEQIAADLGLDTPDIFIPGVLNDISVYDLPAGFTLDGEPYTYLVLGHRYATPNSNTLYAQYTRHDDVFEKWEKVRDDMPEF